MIVVIDKMILRDIFRTYMEQDISVSRIGTLRSCIIPPALNAGQIVKEGNS